MVKKAHLQPDHVQNNFFLHISKNNAMCVHSNVGKIVNKQYPCRFVYSQSGSDLNILKQEISATRATWKEWLTTSDRCRPVIPGKSYTEVLKTDLQSQCMQSSAKK